MSLDAVALFNAVQSHAMTTGLFDRVGTHEPKNAPGNGLTCAIWAAPFGPVPASSGLTVASARVSFLIRLYNPMLQQPQDDIDPTVLDAASKLISAYAGAFTLDGLVRNVDIFGAAGPALGATPGYLNQDGKIFRVIDILLPMIINDVWTELP